jgi:hypothetical protein
MTPMIENNGLKTAEGAVPTGTSTPGMTGALSSTSGA